jgi:hypothetical protein
VDVGAGVGVSVGEGVGVDVGVGVGVVLGTAVLHHTLTHSFSPALACRPAHLSEHPKAWQSQVHVAMSQPDGIPWCGRAGRRRARDRSAASPASFHPHSIGSRPTLLNA